LELQKSQKVDPTPKLVEISKKSVEPAKGLPFPASVPTPVEVPQVKGKKLEAPARGEWAKGAEERRW